MKAKDKLCRHVAYDTVHECKLIRNNMCRIFLTNFCALEYFLNMWDDSRSSECVYMLGKYECVSQWLWFGYI